MLCESESRLIAGDTLSHPTRTATHAGATVYPIAGSGSADAPSARRTRNPGMTHRSNPSSKQAMNGTMVSQFKYARFPEEIRMN
jgi:hypothetical protein